MIQSKQPCAARRRYSNDDVVNGGALPEVTVTGSRVFDWDKFNQTLSVIGSTISNLFSPSWKYQNQTNSELYRQEKRTNTILWVVIGLMVALGVVLLIRKH